MTTLNPKRLLRKRGKRATTHPNIKGGPRVPVGAGWGSPRKDKKMAISNEGTYAVTFWFIRPDGERVNGCLSPKATSAKDARRRVEELFQSFNLKYGIKSVKLGTCGVIAQVLLLALWLPLMGCASLNLKAPYVALGASDTRVGGPTYPTLIADELDRKVLNLGIPGATADMALAEVLPAINAKPEIATLWVGSNDIAKGRTVEEFAVDLDRILLALKQGTTAKVFVANIPDLFLLPKYVATPDADVTQIRVMAFNRTILEAANRHKVYIVDISGPKLTVPELLMPDGFHPNSTAHRLIADAFIRAIRRSEVASRTVSLETRRFGQPDMNRHGDKP